MGARVAAGAGRFLDNAWVGLNAAGHQASYNVWADTKPLTASSWVVLEQLVNDDSVVSIGGTTGLPERQTQLWVVTIDPATLAVAVELVFTHETDSMGLLAASGSTEGVSVGLVDDTRVVACVQGERDGSPEEVGVALLSLTGEASSRFVVVDGAAGSFGSPTRVQIFASAVVRFTAARSLVLIARRSVVGGVLRGQVRLVLLDTSGASPVVLDQHDALCDHNGDFDAVGVDDHTCVVAIGGSPGSLAVVHRSGDTVAMDTIVSTPVGFPTLDGNTAPWLFEGFDDSPPGGHDYGSAAPVTPATPAVGTHHKGVEPDSLPFDTIGFLRGSRHRGGVGLVRAGQPDAADRHDFSWLLLDALGLDGTLGPHVVVRGPDPGSIPLGVSAPSGQQWDLDPIRAHAAAGSSLGLAVAWHYKIDRATNEAWTKLWLQGYRVTGPGGWSVGQIPMRAS